MTSRSAKATILSLGSSSTKIIGLLTAMVLTRILVKEDYATYRQSLLVYNFAAPILLLGLPQALYYLLPNHPEREREIFCNNLMISTFMGLVLTGFLLFGGSDFLAVKFNNPELSSTLRLMAWYPLILFPLAGIDPCLMVASKVKTLAVYHVISRFIILTSVVAAAAIWATPYAAVAGFVGAGLIILGPGLILQFKAITRGPMKVSFQGSIIQLKYAVPLGLASVMGLITTNLDKLLVSTFFDPEVFAIYVNGAMEVPLISQVTGAVTAVLLPDIAIMMKEKRSLDALALWKRAAVKCSLLLFPAMGFLFTLAPEIMVLLFGNDYLQSANPFRCYLLILPIRIAYFGTVMMSAGRSDIIMWRTLIGLCLNVVLSIWMIKEIGYLGAAIATVIVAYSWDFLFNVWYFKKKLFPGSSIFHLRKLGLIASQTLTASLILWFTVQHIHSRSIKLAVGTVLYGFLILFFFHLSATIDIRTFIIGIKKRIRKS